jgi:hypothetical protein
MAGQKAWLAKTSLPVKSSKGRDPASRERKTMFSTVERENIVADIISSYEVRIQGVETLLDTAHQFLIDFQDSVFDTRRQRDKTNDQLRENLAKNGSLRKKDFDTMMSSISSHQDRQEQQARDLSKSYLSEQRKLVGELRANLRSFQQALAQGETQRMKEFQTMINEIFDRQEKRREEVVSKLKEFQKEQEEMAGMLKNLLDKGRQLRTRDLKFTLAEFKRQRKQRIGHQKQRKEQVQSMLSDFRKERLEAAKSRSTPRERI